MAPTPRLIVVPQLMVPPRAATPELPYAVPSLSADLAVAPAGDVAPAYIVGAASQPYFQVITGQSKPLVDSIRADYHIHEGFAHAEYIDGVLQQTPMLIPTATPYLIPSLPETAVEELNKEADAEEVLLVSTDVVEEQENAETSFVSLTATPSHFYSHLNFEQHAPRTLEEIMRDYFHRVGERAESFNQRDLANAFKGFSSQDIRTTANHVFGSLRTTGACDDRMFSLHDHILTHF